MVIFVVILSGVVFSVHCSFWRRGSVVRSSVFGQRTFPDLCPIYVDRWPIWG